jgi:hypothetical protein
VEDEHNDLAEGPSDQPAYEDAAMLAAADNFAPRPGDCLSRSNDFIWSATWNISAIREVAESELLQATAMGDYFHGVVTEAKDLQRRLRACQKQELSLRKTAAGVWEQSRALKEAATDPRWANSCRVKLDNYRDALRRAQQAKIGKCREAIQALEIFSTHLSSMFTMAEHLVAELAVEDKDRKASTVWLGLRAGAAFLDDLMICCRSLADDISVAHRVDFDDDYWQLDVQYFKEHKDFPEEEVREVEAGEDRWVIKKW